MAANRTRVQVRGSIGKSVHISSPAGTGGATIGVDLRLPNGTIPTLQQLAAALQTGAATQDLPGNISGPGGAQPLVWQNIQYVPQNILNPPKWVPDESTTDDALIVPGPAGAAGATGAGTPGVTIPMYPDDGEDALPIPGPQGLTGTTGLTGSVGPTGAGIPGVTIPMYPDDGEDALPIPGPIGPAGPAGSVVTGVNITPDTHPSATPIYNDEFETGSVIDTAGTRFAGASAWTAFNIGTGSTAVQQGALSLLPALSAANAVNGYSQPITGATWSYTTKFSLYGPGSAAGLGMFVAINAAGKFLYLNVFSAGAASASMAVQRYTNSTTFSSTVLSGAASNYSGVTLGPAFGWVYLRIGYDGTNISFYSSVTGVEGTFFKMYSETPAAFLGGNPTIVGVCGNLQSATVQGVALYDWFRKTL